MNGVKGLVFKEIYLRRKTFLTGITVFILLFILSVSFCLSLDYGNLKDNENIDTSAAVILSYGVAGMGIMLFSQNTETIVKDKKCKWNIFERTLPLSAKKLAAVRIGVLTVSNLIGFVLAVLLSRVMFTLSHNDFNAAVIANISVIAMIVFLLMVLANFMNLKYSDPQKAATNLIMGLFIIGVLAEVFVYRKFSELQARFSELTEEELEKIIADEYLTHLAEFRDRLFPFFILIFAAFAVIGYFMFLTLYKRREK